MSKHYTQQTPVMTDRESIMCAMQYVIEVFDKVQAKLDNKLEIEKNTQENNQ